MPARSWSIRLFVGACCSLVGLVGGCAAPAPFDPAGPSEPASPLSRGLIAIPPVELLPAEPDVFVVKLTPGADPQTVATRLGLDLLRVLDDDTVVFANVNDSGDLDADPQIAAHEPNQRVTLAFGQELTMGFFEGAGFEPTDLKNSEALIPLGLSRAHAFTDGRGVKVGVIDTGVDPTHPWLAKNVVKPTGPDAMEWVERANGIDDDGDSLIDEAFGHGTMVAGVIRQIAPGASLVPVRALDSDGVGSLGDVLSALDAMKANQVHVVNLSLSLSEFSPLFEERVQSLQQSGIVIVAASGNSAGATSYPASSSHVLGVAALDATATIASFSNHGSDCELAAPGVGILSAYPLGRLGWGDGTSFAAPIVAGAAALLRSSGQAVDVLLQTAHPMENLAHGAVDLGACFVSRGRGDRERDPGAVD